MASSNRLRTLLPVVALIALVATGLGAGYYFASANSGPTVAWQLNPLRHLLITGRVWQRAGLVHVQQHRCTRDTRGLLEST